MGWIYSNTALTLVLAKGYEVESYHSSTGQMPHQKYNDSNNYLAVVRQLIDYGANINTPREDGLTPLHIAYLRRDKKAIDFLCQYGADVKAVDSYSRVPIDYLNISYLEAHDILSKITQSFYLLPNEREFDDSVENILPYVKML